MLRVISSNFGSQFGSWGASIRLVRCFVNLGRPGARLVHKSPKGLPGRPRSHLLLMFDGVGLHFLFLWTSHSVYGYSFNRSIVPGKHEEPKHKEDKTMKPKHRGKKQKRNQQKKAAQKFNITGYLRSAHHHEPRIESIVITNKALPRVVVNSVILNFGYVSKINPPAL